MSSLFTQTNTKMSPEEVLIVVRDAVTLLKPIVQKIESSVPLTKNHYGRYMEILSTTPAERRQMMAACLILAGANKEGVKNAKNLVS